MKNPKLTLSIDPRVADRVIMGKYNYGWDNSPRLNFYLGDTKLIIGSFCSFAPGVVLQIGGEHFTDYITTYPFSAIFEDVPTIPCVGTKGNIVIGSDVWIATGVMILSGVTIGDGAVLGAGAVIAKNVSPYSIVVGNPGRVIRKRFSDAQIEKLLEIKWWDWNDEEIEKAIPYLMNVDIEKFIEYAEVRV